VVCPGTTTNSAPGIHAAHLREPSIVVRGSFSPTMTSVGTSIFARSGLRVR